MIFAAISSMRYRRGNETMNIHKKLDISAAESLRYAKIQNLMDLLQGTGNSIQTGIALGDTVLSPFKVGERIIVDGEILKVGRRVYHAREIAGVTINTEGSMAVYGSRGRKLCGTFSLNVSSRNIELFCVWARQNRIPVRILSCRKERAFQYILLFLVFAAVVCLKFF